MLSTDILASIFSKLSQNRTMFLVGLTGGIATGKSTVANVFRELGCPVIDSDQIARQIVQLDSPVYWAIVNTFGQEILLEDRTINRERLGNIIFSDREKRQLLNSITHPAIHKAMLKQVIKYFIQGYRYVILDVPLLFETKKVARFMKHTIVVYCDPQAQLTRLMQRNNLIQEDAEQRISAQMPLEQKRKMASHVIDNSGDPASTYRQVYKLHSQLEDSMDFLAVRLLAVVTVTGFGGLLYMLMKRCII
ncbi:dephospho-CoA kinase domain-containing protein [Amblyraja radiata]|uniref:dephospho-CoA kinase domain-containing protein n=1 Tax=Amblyraja radiata TaxID=386614 RepID=UPI0014021DB8|nr:dephospho-CoA kinase domain-containing protein [Amblyraja radiata]